MSTTSELQWHYTHIQGGGEKWRLYDPDSGLYFVTIVRLPGSLYRLFLSGGRTLDVPSAYLAHCEVRKVMGTDEVPFLTNRSDREHQPHS